MNGCRLFRHVCLIAVAVVVVLSAFRAGVDGFPLPIIGRLPRIVGRYAAALSGKSVFVARRAPVVVVGVVFNAPVVALNVGSVTLLITFYISLRKCRRTKEQRDNGNNNFLHDFKIFKINNYVLSLNVARGKKVTCDMKIFLDIWFARIIAEKTRGCFPKMQITE